MENQLIIYFILVIIAISYFFTKRKALMYKKNISCKKYSMHSLPKYYGYYAAMWAGIPALALLLIWISFESVVIDKMLANKIPNNIEKTNIGLVLNDIKLSASVKTEGNQTAEKKRLYDYYKNLKLKSKNLKSILVLLIALSGSYFGLTKVSSKFRARVSVERGIKILLISCSSIAIVTTLGIVISVLFESIIFFKAVNPIGFLFGTHWSPTAIDPSFGVIPLFAGTLLISLIALIISVPIGLMAAIYLSEYANQKIRTFAKPVLELLAGIPTVVYGFFAVLTIAPFIRNTFYSFGISASSESALAAGIVMGVMIIPFVSSLSDDVISAVPQYLRDGSLGLGATKSETIKQVILPAALPGVVGGILLAASRAIGETMIVVMAAGLAANLTANPLQAVTTVTVQIVTLLTGDQEFDSPKTLAAFALALLLFVVTLSLNLFALRIVKKYREQYD